MGGCPTVSDRRDASVGRNGVEEQASKTKETQNSVTVTAIDFGASQAPRWGGMSNTFPVPELLSASSTA